MIQKIECFEGFVIIGSQKVQVSFEAPENSSSQEKDAAFVAALSKIATLDYLSVGSEPMDELSNYLNDAPEAADLSKPTRDFSSKNREEKVEAFISEIASLRIWSYDNDDGVAYKECADPSDGYLDSHCCLMNLIEEARRIKE